MVAPIPCPHNWRIQGGRDTSVAQAVRLEKRQASDDCWLDDDWKKSQPNAGAGVMGFAVKRRKHSRRHV